MKADLQTGNVIGSHYNTQPRISFNYPWYPQTSYKKSNQGTPPLTSLDPHQDQTSVAKCKTSTPKINNNKLDTISGHNIEEPYLTQTPLHQDIDRQTHDMDNIMKTQMPHPEED